VGSEHVLAPDKVIGRPPPVIAVDGPAGSGKSTAARAVATAVGLRYLDTGAMYRALTWWLLDRQIEIADVRAVLAALGRPSIEVGTDPAEPGVRVDGQDVSREIRTRAVSNAVSAVAAIPQVRERLIAEQRRIIADVVAGGYGVVVDGRDIGSVVAPDAPVKVYLTATEAVRARRRSADLAADPAATAELTRLEQARRDKRDAPQMVRAEDAIEIDTTRLTAAEVAERIAGLARERAVLPGSPRNGADGQGTSSG
jgi:cytidylate kinase